MELDFFDEPVWDDIVDLLGDLVPLAVFVDLPGAAATGATGATGTVCPRAPEEEVADVSAVGTVAGVRRPSSRLRISRITGRLL